MRSGVVVVAKIGAHWTARHHRGVNGWVRIDGGRSRYGSKATAVLCAHRFIEAYRERFGQQLDLEVRG